MTALGQVQCLKCAASTASRIGGEHVLPADPNWTFVRGENGIEFLCPQCQIEQKDPAIPIPSVERTETAPKGNISGSLASRLVGQLIKRGVRQKLNDALSELKREFGSSLSRDELYEVGFYSLELMLIATDEFVADMKRKYERDRLTSPSVSARGRKESPYIHTDNE